MADTKLVELKRLLNTVVPQSLDHGHTALPLNEDAADPAFMNTYSRSIETIQRYITGSGSNLQALAGSQANLLSAVQVTGELDAATIAAINMLSTAAAADTSNRVGSDTKQLLAILRQISDGVQALPEDTRRSMNTESRRLLSTRGTAATPPKTATQQAQELMTLSDSYLGVTGNPATNSDVLENTGRALKDYLKAQRALNPDISVDFTPQRVDVRTAAFLAELLRKKMEEAGVKPEDLQSTMMQLWLMQSRGEQHPNAAMRELGQVGAMKGLVDYIVSGRVPSGDMTSQRPRTDSPWENPVKDRFFNREVYGELLNGHIVSAKALLRPDNADPAQQALIRSIAERLGFDLNAQTFTRDQVGQIATEIMAHQARALCIDERDISRAMLEGRFNPHQDDVFLAKIGFGKPERDQGRSEQLERIGIPREQQHDIYFRAQFDDYRDQKWVQRFGAIDDDHLFRLAQRLRPDLIPQNMDLKYEDLKDQPHVRMVMDDLRHRRSSAASLFEWGGRGMVDPYNFREAYRRLREDRYLPDLRERVNENGLNLCAQNPGAVAAPSAAPPTGTCFADDIDGPCKPGAPQAPRAGAGDCFVEDFRGACGTSDASNADRIRGNAADSTGQPITPDTGCYVEDQPHVPGCRTPEVAAPPR